MNTPFMEIFHYRSLLWFLSIRDWKEQTRKTFLGFFWTLAYPFVLGGVFCLLFGRIFSNPGDPYAPGILCALVAWQLFSQTLILGAGILAKNYEIFRKVRFPTEVLFLSHILCRTVQFVIWLLILEIFLFRWGFGPSVYAWQIVPWLLMQSLLALGILLLVSPAGLLTRDIEQGLALILLLWFYATPIVYPLSWVSSRLPAAALSVYMSNPMVGIVEGYRDALLGRPGALYENPAYVLFLFMEVLFLCAVGYFLYKKAEPYFAQAA